MDNKFYLFLDPARKQYFSLPPHWVVDHFVERKDDIYTSVSQMMINALLKPVGTAPLKDLIRNTENIVVIIDDDTRPTPVADILRVLLPYLADAGIPTGRITIVVAIGTHDPMNIDEIAIRVGTEVASRYSVVQHDAWQDNLTHIDILGYESKLKINPVVAQADFRISISSILPHRMAGYGGGPKILMPGVSNFDFIREHHMKREIHPQSKVGVTEGNPFHEDCMKAAKAIGLHFSINCVYDHQGNVAGIVAGSLEIAFASAVKACEERLGHYFEDKVDVTIASAYPHIHGEQFTKGLTAPDIITKEDGAILLVVPLVENIPDDFVESFDFVRKQSNNNCIEYLKDKMSRGCLFLPEKPLGFNQAVFSTLFRPPVRTILVAPMISRAQAVAMGMEYAETIEDGLAILEKAYPKARVAVLPSGGLVVPII